MLGARGQPGRARCALRRRSSGANSSGRQPARRYEKVGPCALSSAFAEPWPRRAYRPSEARAVPGAGAIARPAPAHGQVQRSAGSGPEPWPRTIGPTSSSSSATARRGKVGEIESGGARAPPTPALARAQRPRAHIGPTPHACAAFRPPFALAAPSPPLPCPPTRAGPLPVHDTYRPCVTGVT